MSGRNLRFTTQCPLGIYDLRFTIWDLRFTSGEGRAVKGTSGRTIQRRHVLFAALLLLVFLFLIWRLLPLPDDGTLAEVQARGTLRVGLDASFPPFESMDEQGQIVGLDVDIARAIAADLGVEAEFVNIGFDGLYDALLARRVDLIISSLPYDPRRTEDVAYTRNYFNAGQVLVTRAGEASIQAAGDLAGRPVAVEWGSLADMEARRLNRKLSEEAGESVEASAVSGELKLLRKETAAAALEAVFSGEAEAAIVDAPSAVSAFPRGLRLVTYLTDEWYTAAVHIESRKLLAAINDSLTRLEESGQLAEMQARWFHGQ